MFDVNFKIQFNAREYEKISEVNIIISYGLLKN